MCMHFKVMCDYVSLLKDYITKSIFKEHFLDANQRLQSNSEVC